MKYLFHISLFALFIVVSASIVSAEDGRPYYYLGCFAYEEEKLSDAENYLLYALRLEPDNPMYHHYLGKTYLKTGQYDKSEKHLMKAAQSNLPEAHFDLGMLAYKTGKFEKSLALFDEAIRKNLKDASSAYYAGMSAVYLGRCEDAGKYFEKAYLISPSIRDDCQYMSELCIKKSQKDSTDMQTSLIGKSQKQPKSYSFSIRLSRFYDDNVPLEPDNREIYSDKKDQGTEAMLSGSYEFFKKDNYAVGAGIFHHQVWHDELGDNDRSATVLDVYAKYSFKPFEFKLSYFPTYYRTDSESSLRQHSISPEFLWMFRHDMGLRLRYIFSSNHDFLDETRDGNSNEISADIYYRLPKTESVLFLGIGYKDNGADRSDESYQRWLARIGFSAKIVWNMKLMLIGEYEDTRYSDINSYYNVIRDDDTYSLSFSLSKQMFYEWLNVIAEYEYAKRDSVILPMEYSRNRVALALEAKF